MAAYETPGVYYEARDISAGGVNTLRTDIAAFVGISQRGPVGLAVPVESWKQFQAYFGSFVSTGYLAYVVRAFIENGGRRCWVVRIGSETTATAGISVFDSALPPGQPLWRIEASSAGAWGNDLEIRVRELRRQQARAVVSGVSLDYVTVDSTSSFRRYDLVALRQGPITETRVISRVDQVARRIIFFDPDEALPRPYFRPLPPTITLSEPLLLESVAYSIEVYEAGTLARAYDDVSVVPDHARYGPRLVPPLLEQSRSESVPQQESPSSSNAAFESGRFILPALPHQITIREADPAGVAARMPSPLKLPVAPGGASSKWRLAGGVDGLAQLTFRDFLGEESDPKDDDPEAARKRRGLASLNSVAEISMVAIPDIHIDPRGVPPLLPVPPCIPDPCLPPPPPAGAIPVMRSAGDLPPRFGDADVLRVQTALVDHCERRRDRVALLDAPLTSVKDPRIGADGIERWRRNFDSGYAALYFPWLDVVDPLRLERAPLLRVPPCGHVAGQIAEWDLRVGTHRAPANRVLTWAQDASFTVRDELHALLNPAGINVIRPLPGRGIRVFGARTISSDPDWRFLNVRRLLISIRRALEAALQWAAFEPNNLVTRTKIDLSIRTYLRTLWERGALQGEGPEQAFFVRCDDSNNPAPVRDRGELIVDIGVAPSIPFEFVVVRVGRQNNGFEYAELGMTGRGG